MLRFRFKMDVYEGDDRVVEDHVTDVYQYPDATALANSIIRCASHATRGLHVETPPKTQNIQLPPLPGGYGPNTVHVIKEAIEVRGM